MITYYQLDTKEIVIEINKFSSRKCIRICLMNVPYKNNITYKSEKVFVLLIVTRRVQANSIFRAKRECCGH